MEEESNTDGNNNKGSSTVDYDDPLFLQGSDHPGLVLVTDPLIGNNFRTWNRSMRIALGAKNKLGFINGKIKQPDESSDDYERWNRVDCMVTSWILNSIAKDIAVAFLYAQTARELWLEIQERYGESNEPMIYQLQREIGEYTQGNLSVTQYFNNLKKLWDELNCLLPIPVCTCGASKLVAEITASSRLMQFLTGLNDSFDQNRDQILLMEPLPTVNKAYSMILKIEKQRNVQTNFPDKVESTALFSRNFNHRNEESKSMKENFENSRGSNTYNRRFDQKKDKEGMHCSHCNRNGHDRDTCFKLHGYPDWYKTLREQRNQTGGKGNVANAAETPFDELDDGAIGGSDSKLTNLIQQEIAKMMRGQLGTAGPQVHFAQIAEYAGPEE